MGSRIGLPRVAELILETPLTWASDRPVQVRIVVAPAASAPGGMREVVVHSRPEPVAASSISSRPGTPGAPTAQECGDEWARHASGLLAPAADLVAQPATGA
ncbi:hypothetical protein, partial [Streptomyces caniscabiei]|uniref:hypothetical protein n=1 Tax=Streptomyces caniscabiei TaxID=2746961 RepID=UPI00117CF116